MNEKRNITDLLIFLIGGILVFINVYWIVPLLSDKLNIMQIGSWMITSPFVVFIPLIITGLYILKSEKTKISLIERTRFKKLSKSDWKWVGLGLLGMTVLSGLTFYMTNIIKLDPNPPFSRQVEPWQNGHLWLFLIWIIYWPINIIGEGFIWRGVIQPRLENTFKQNTWIICALFWGVFHFSFGLGNLIVLIPTLIFVPFITQKTKNTWTGIILHATLSGPGFIILALGLMNK